MAAQQRSWLRRLGDRLHPGLAGRVSLVVLPVTVVASLAMAAVILHFSNRVIDRLVTEQGRQIADRFVQDLTRDIDRRLELIDGLSRLIRIERASGAPSRRRIGEWMRDTSEGRPTEFGIWFVAEPNALGDDRAYRGAAELGHADTGRFQPYFVHDGRTARFETLPADIEGDARYRGARESGRAVITPPYRAIAGGRDRLLTTVALPVWHGGRLLGIVGTDFELNTEAAKIRQVRPLEGRTSLVGPHGNWLFHRDPARVGRPASGGDPDLDADIRNVIQTGLPQGADVTVDGETFRRYIHPIDVGLTGRQLVAVTDLPLRSLALPVREMEYLVVAIALVFSILLYLVLQTLVRRTIGRPLHRLSAAVEALEQGEPPEHLRESLRHDEVGSIARAIERLRLSLSEQRRLQRELDRMLGALEHASDAVLLTDREGRIVYANPGLAALAGLPPGRIRPGMPASSMVSAAGIERRMQPGMPGAALAQGRNWQGVLENWEVLGGRVVDAVAMSMTVLPQKDVLFVARDVSQERRAARERDELHAQLLHQDRLDALGRLTGGIAHEFNNLLAAMLGYAELLTGDLAEGTPEHGFAVRIEQTALRARDLVGRLVTFARAELVEDTVFDLGAAVTDALAMLRVTVRAGIAIDCKAEGGRLPVAGNEGQLVQMLMNLCLNARDSIEEARGGSAASGPQDQGRIDIFAGAADHWHARLLANGVAHWPDTVIGTPDPGLTYFVLSVRDNGTGIPEAEFGRIFDPFFTTKPRGKGSGLGLASVFGILRSWQGHIRLRSALGEGAQFELYLPVDRDERVSIPAPAATGQGAASLPEGAARTILLVDDEAALAEATRDALERRGHAVTVATDPLRALALLHGTAVPAFDLLISDRNMPRMMGDELVRRARALQPELTCVLCTGHAEGLDREALREAGIAAIFRKPVRATELAAWIEGQPPH